MPWQRKVLTKTIYKLMTLVLDITWTTTITIVKRKFQDWHIATSSRKIDEPNSALNGRIFGEFSYVLVSGERRLGDVKRYTPSLSLDGAPELPRGARVDFLLRAIWQCLQGHQFDARRKENTRLSNMVIPMNTSILYSLVILFVYFTKRCLVNTLMIS